MLKLSQLTKQKPEHALLGSMLIVILLILITSFGQSVVYYLVVFVYPIYKSINAYETQNKQDTLKYLNYWLIFGVFYCFKPLFDYVFSYLILPTLMKSLFFLYVYCPLTDGYKVIYELGIRRVLRLYE